MPSRRRSLVRFLLLAFWVACLAPSSALAEGSMVVVMDGSGSMWGTMEGTRQTKLLIARESLRSSLAKVAPQARVGLTLFGHRRGDCSDVEVVRPPEPRDVQRILEPLEKLNPRGRGPITLGVREAAKALGREPKPRSVLVIHDDADNCQPDLCTAAAELQANGITAHVVSISVKPDDIPKMACLPQTTGGRHFIAQTPEQASAYIEEAVLLAASGMGGVTAPSNWTTKTDIVPPQPVPASGPPALHLRALLAPNTEPLGQPLFWTVAAEDKPDVFLFSARAVNPTVPVSPGRYVVEAREGSISAKQIAEVRENRPASVTVVLNAGAVRVRALARRNGGPLGQALTTVIGESGTLLVASSSGEATALVPAGRVLVRAELGTTRAEQGVTIAPGRLFAIDLPLDAAHLEVSTPARADGSFELDAPVFAVQEDDPDAPDGRREIARSAAQPASFVLPPGTYYLSVRQGAVEARDRLAIGAGDTVRRILSAPAGTLSLTTRPPPFGASPEPHISYRVSRTDNPAQDPIVTSQASPTLLLPAGRYRVEARYGLMNVRSVQDIDIRAGQAQHLTIEHQAAGLTLRMPGAGLDAAWVIQDQSGRTVWTGALPDALTSLQAGRYLVRAETRSKRVERTIDLKAGENRLLELPVE